MDSHEIQNKNKLDYQRKQQNKLKPPSLLKIGDYHPETGRHKVIFPNGGEVIAGNKLFNSSVPVGTPIRGTQAFGSQVIWLDYRNYVPPLLAQEEEVSGLFDTYILCFLDTSGSMNNDLATIVAALEQLRDELKDRIYGDQERTDKYFRIIEEPYENWLGWFAFDPRENNNEPDKTLMLAFINEAQDVYHQIPRRLSLEPTSTFLSDRDKFLSSYQKRQFFRGRVYSVQYPPMPELEEAFSAHVRDAVDGVGVYPSPGLNDFGCSYTLGIPASTTAEFYLENIKELLEL